MKHRTKILLLDIVIALLYGLSGATVAAASIVAYRAWGVKGLVAALLWFGATWADALTPVGLLNFLVLQWFGVRVCKRYMTLTANFDALRLYERVNTTSSDGNTQRWRVVNTYSATSGRLMRFGVQRWIIPLTGWWTDYRYIARRS